MPNISPRLNDVASGKLFDDDAAEKALGKIYTSAGRRQQEFFKDFLSNIAKARDAELRDAANIDAIKRAMMSSLNADQLRQIRELSEQEKREKIANLDIERRSYIELAKLRKDLTEEQKEAEIDAINEKYRQEVAAAKSANNDIAKQEQDRRKKEAKDKLKAAREEAKRARKDGDKDAKKTAMSNLKDAANEGIASLIGDEESIAGQALKSFVSSENLKGIIEGTVNPLAAMAAKAIGSAISSIGKFTDDAFSKAENILTTYQASIDARLAGSTRSWSSAESIVGRNLTFSNIAKQTAVLENLNKLVSAGIEYNVEQRAFLETVSESIATTFSAFDGNLMRMIRIQQADSTAARMGMEAVLTEQFNKWFEDTSYLSDTFDSVSQALIDASSQLSNTASVEFEYIVQKWLGALGSVGVSGNALTNIAQGIGYLGSGNVAALTGNQQLNTLLAMSANRAGLDYAQLLTGGLTAQSTNELLKSMVEYLGEIAGNTEANKVVRSAYGGILGLTAADFTAISNLSNNIGGIYSSSNSYNSLVEKTENRISGLNTSLNMATQLSNVYENAMYGIGSNIVNNPVGYLTYKAADFLEDYAGGVPIPIPLVGQVKTSDLLKTAIFGISAVEELVGLAGNLFTGGATNLSNWNASDTVSSSLDNGGGMDLSQYSGGSRATSVRYGNASGAEALEPSLAESSEVQATVESAMPENNEELDTADKLNLLCDNINGAMSDNALNVNIKGLADISSIPVSLAGENVNLGGYEQMKQLLATVSEAFGIHAGSETNLQTLIDFFVNVVGGNDTSGLNVNLAGNEVSATSFLTGTTGFERY